MRRSILLFFLLSAGLLMGLDSAVVENISKSASPSEDVHIAINTAGEIGAVWVEKFSTGNQQVFFAVRRNGQWTAAEAISGQSGVNADPGIAKGVNGGFVAVWYDQTTNCIRFSQYQGTWSTPVTVSPVGGYDFGWPAVTTTTNGRIAVAWMRGNPLFSDVYVTVYRNGWSNPVNVSNTPYGSKYCDLTPGPNGEIYAVWQDDRGDDNFRTMMNTDRGDGSWTQPFDINSIQGWCFRPVVAVNSRNDILSCYFFMQQQSYWASFRLNGVWQNPLVISDVGAHRDHDYYFSGVCAYEDGFLYIYRDSAFNIIYTVARDGKAGKAVALTDSSQCYRPSIDYSSAMGAVAAWTDRSGNNDVFVTLFDPQDASPEGGILPPLNVVADYRKIPLAAAEMKTDLIVNRTLFTGQYFRKITWAFDSRWTDWNLTLAKYRIYRKLKTSDSWEIQAEVGPSVLSYIDKNGVVKEDRFDYRVLGVDTLGNEFYAYNRITWAANPANADRKIVVQNYNVYRRLRGSSVGGYSLWKTVDVATFFQEDRSLEIRQQTEYEYALTSISDKNRESLKAAAQKVTSSTLQARMLGN